MSYTYLLEQAEESSAECFLDIPAYVLSRLNLTPVKSYFNASGTASCRAFRYGTTSEHLTANRGVGLSQPFAAVSRAKTFPQPEKAQESTANEADCGQKWRVLFAKLDPGSCLWKTPHCLPLAGLDEFLGTWPRWGMMRDGECWEQTTPARHTEENESGFWPTPRSCSAMAATITPESANAPGRFPNLETVVGRKMWPTPDTCAGGTGPSQMKRNQPCLQDAVRGASPTARDWKGETVTANYPQGFNQSLPNQAGGHLNPPWVEWLMGWPIGWTDLKPLAMAKFQRWPRSHGAFSLAIHTEKTPLSSPTRAEA